MNYLLVKFYTISGGNAISFGPPNSVDNHSIFCLNFFYLVVVIQ